MTPLRTDLPWHTCAQCKHCDGTADRHCTWSAACGGAGHQDAACWPSCVRQRKTKPPTTTAKEPT